MRCVSLTDLPHMSRSYHLNLFYFQSTTVASFEIYKRGKIMFTRILECTGIHTKLGQ